ncbi:hypothetical protein JMUB6875_26250 [Nocardia sp. JMUB6875]
MTTPFGVTRVSATVNAVGTAFSGNSRLPVPRMTGKVRMFRVSTRSAASSERMSAPAAVDLEFAARAGLQLGDLLERVAVQEFGAGPVGVVEGAGRDVLGEVVELVRDGVARQIVVGPVAREDLVGLAAEEESVDAVEDRDHEFAEGIVTEGRGPAAVREPPARIFRRSTRRLIDTVDGDELGDRQFHDVLLWAPVPEAWSR